jgi:integrase/recombinase XerD
MSVLSYSTPWALEHLHKGPLGPHIDGFAASLSEQGYTKHTARVKLRLAASLSCWLQRRQLGLHDLDERQVEKFLEYRRRHGLIRRGNASTLLQLIRYLRETGVIPVPVTQTNDNELLRLERGFCQYLTQERGLSQPTLINYLSYVRRFLHERFGANNIVLDDVRSPDISRFILRHAHTMSPGRAKLMVTAFRSFFRYLLWRGDISADLAAAVPAVADWRLSTLPKSLPPQDVEHLLQSIDRTTATGRRNYAILLLLARLGLRAGEVVAMTLDDINWNLGEVTIHGKGLRTDKLPLPPDVGEALAAYLRYGRPQCSTRRVFILMKAPRRGFANSSDISSIVSRALTRAGLNPARRGAHLLRHSLAGRMLQGGASLQEIGEVLRHQMTNTTEIYTKVSLAVLRPLAQPWPREEAVL